MKTTIITTFYGYVEGPVDINPDIPLDIVEKLMYPHWRLIYYDRISLTKVAHEAISNLSHN